MMLEWRRGQHEYGTPSWAQNPTATSFFLSSYFPVVYNKL